MENCIKKTKGYSYLGDFEKLLNSITDELDVLTNLKTCGYFRGHYIINTNKIEQDHAILFIRIPGATIGHIEIGAKDHIIRSIEINEKSLLDYPEDIQTRMQKYVGKELLL